MKRKIPVVAIVRSTAAMVVVVFLVMLLSGSFNEKISPGVLAAAGIAVPENAVTATVAAETFPVFEEATGTVEAQRRTTVSARILATIDAILVSAGDEVRQGDVLIRLEDAELLARMEEARRAVDAAAASARQRAADLQRARKLLGTGVMSRSEFDQIEAAASVTAAELQRSREIFERVRINQTYSTITAPVSGKVIDRLAEPGDTATPGTPLLSLYDPAALRIEVPVRESLLSRLHPGATLEVRIGRTEPVMGIVDEIVPYAEAGSRTFLVKIGLPRREGTYAGMFGRVFLPAGERSRLLVARSAIERIGQLTFATVVGDDGNVQRRLVTVGRESEGERVEVLSGLAAGETVLLSAELDREAGVDLGDE
jgi:RND family efflux transporter MFP subunit